MVPRLVMVPFISRPLVGIIRQVLLGGFCIIVMLINTTGLAGWQVGTDISNEIILKIHRQGRPQIIDQTLV